MSASNVFHLIGNLTADSELKYSNGGMAIVKFSVAQNYRKKQGEEWVDAVNFFEVTMFGKHAEALKPYLNKGQPVAIDGEVRQDRWTNDAGEARSKHYVLADDLKLLVKREAGAGGQTRSPEARQEPPVQQQERQASRQPATGEQIPAADQFDDDIPF